MSLTKGCRHKEDVVTHHLSSPPIRAAIKRMLLPNFLGSCGWLIVLATASCLYGMVHESAPSHSFQFATPGFSFQFPRDHGAHPSFRTEWWYYTGHLSAPGDRRFGFQVTFFRRGLRTPPNPSKWSIKSLYLAHFTLSDIEGTQFHMAEKISRAALGKAGAEQGRLHVWIDDWTVRAVGGDHQGQELRAATDTFSVHLILDSLKSPISHGIDGVSQKGDAPGQTSHYYSLTRLKTKGSLSIDGLTLPVEGTSWMDHEFGSADLAEDLVGWDWFSIQFDEGSELMYYSLRQPNGSPHAVSSGTYIPANGQPIHLTREDIQTLVRDYWISPKSHASYPHSWSLSLPRLGLSVEIQPLLDDQELVTTKSTQVTYWEGAVKVSGTRNGSQITGQGYVELTGYSQPFDKPL